MTFSWDNGISFSARRYKLKLSLLLEWSAFFQRQLFSEDAWLLFWCSSDASLMLWGCSEDAEAVLWFLRAFLLRGAETSADLEGNNPGRWAESFLRLSLIPKKLKVDPKHIAFGWGGPVRLFSKSHHCQAWANLRQFMGEEQATQQTNRSSPPNWTP